MTPIAAAVRQHLIQIENPGTPVPNGDGGFTTPYVAASPASEWAAIQPASARDLERVVAGTVLATATHLVTIPYRTDVTAQTQIVFGTRRFSVNGVTNPGERDIDLVLACTEVV